MVEEIYSKIRYLRGNINEIWKTLEDKKRKKECLEEEIYQGDLQQEICLDGQIKGMMKKIREELETLEREKNDRDNQRRRRN